MSRQPGAATDPRRTVYVATGNRGKLREIEALLAPTPFVPVLYSAYVSPVEGVRSYGENAALKARALHAALPASAARAGVLADDSGLEVAALGGRPGVSTADYGGAGAAWPDRRRLLLAELAATSAAGRRARFVCAMHFIDSAGREFAALGTVDGSIATEERGELGFSFDPIFLYDAAGKTFAQLSEDAKNAVSHRAIATAAIVAAVAAAARRLPDAASARGESAAERE